MGLEHVLRNETDKNNGGGGGKKRMTESARMWMVSTEGRRGCWWTQPLAICSKR